MFTAVLLALAIVAVDQSLKWFLRRSLAGRAVSLWRLGSLRMVSGNIWLARFSEWRPAVVIGVWLIASLALLSASVWVPRSELWIGALLGGSCSHAGETALRGSVSDYVCLRFWPAFNLADVAITVGAIGVVVTAVQALG